MGFTKSCCNAPKNKPSFEELPELSKKVFCGIEHVHDRFRRNGRTSFRQVTTVPEVRLFGGPQTVRFHGLRNINKRNAGID